MSTVSERESGPREMSFRGFRCQNATALLPPPPPLQKKKLRHQVSTGNYSVTFQSPARNQSGGRKGKDADQEQHWLLMNPAWRSGVSVDVH